MNLYNKLITNNKPNEIGRKRGDEINSLTKEIFFVVEKGFIKDTVLLEISPFHFKAKAK